MALHHFYAVAVTDIYDLQCKAAHQLSTRAATDRGSDRCVRSRNLKRKREGEYC
jgi:hypothetical protein